MVEGPKIAQRMKAADGVSVPQVESHKQVKKLPANTQSKKRKSEPGFGLSYGSEITRIEDNTKTEEQDENHHHTHTKKPPKTVGGAPPAKKLKGPPPDRSIGLYKWMMNKAPLTERPMYPHPQKSPRQDPSRGVEALETKTEEMTLSTSNTTTSTTMGLKHQQTAEEIEEQHSPSAEDDFDSLFMSNSETKITDGTAQDASQPKPKSQPNGKVKKSTAHGDNNPEPKSRQSTRKTGLSSTAFDDEDDLSDPKPTPTRTVRDYFTPKGKGATSLMEKEETIQGQDVAMDITSSGKKALSPKTRSKGTRKAHNKQRLDSDPEEEEEEEEEKVKPPQYKRLVKRSNHPKSAIVSSSSESEDRLTSPDLELVPETRSPSPSTKKSQNFMASYLSATTASPQSTHSTPATTPVPAKLSSTLAKSSSFPTVQAKYGSKRPLPLKKKSKKKNNFSDSDRDRAHSEIDDSSSDWDDSFIKLDEKPDPNQKAITSMFSASSRPVIPPKPRTKRELSSQSQALLSGGLSNYSNTCYLNSVLQSLRNTVECRDTFFGIQEKMHFIESKIQSAIKLTVYQRSFFESALAVMRDLDRREGSSSQEESFLKAVYPNDIISTLHGGESLFNSHSQQDAAEFMFYIISQFDDVLREVTQAGQQESLAPEDRIPKDWQPINELFQVSTQSVTHCLKCPAVTTNEDRGIDLTVQIDNENPTLVRDLNWGIMETMKMEHMKDDNQRFCEKCNTKEEAHVFHYFTSLPKILILRLQRYNFKEGAIKLQNSVSCTEQLNFQEWMCGEYKGPDPRYELCAVIIHRGRVITSGHYYVYIRKPTTIETIVIEPDGETRIEKKTYKWLKYNDSVVDLTSDEEMAKLFSGNVSTSPDASPVPGSESSNPGTPKKDLWNLLESDAATPYVYIYRRVEESS